MSTYLVTYKVGDIVDIKANSAEQKGMPHKVSTHTVPVPAHGQMRGDADCPLLSSPPLVTLPSPPAV